jgi:hypothetical protein
MSSTLGAGAVCHFDAVPVPVLRRILGVLPVDVRGRASAVCRGWRDVLADPSLWQVLDLTLAGFEAARWQPERTQNLVLGAARRAAGQLRVLNITGTAPHDTVRELLVAVVVSDGAELQQVTTNATLSKATLDAVFAAAPRLQALNADLLGPCTELLPVLRNDPPYGPMRVSALHVRPADRQVPLAADVLPFAAAVASHQSLKCLNLRELRFARGLNALVDAAAERRVETLQISRCTTDAGTVPALARLLQRGSLTTLEVRCPDFPEAQEASMAALCAALRACHTLTSLELWLNPREGASHRTVTEVLDAAAALPALAEVSFWGSEVQDVAAFGQALGALLAANLPSLHTLIVYDCLIGDEGLAPMLDGLAANTHLRELHCTGNNPSEAFTRDRLTPAREALYARSHA